MTILPWIGRGARTPVVAMHWCIRVAVLVAGCCGGWLPCSAAPESLQGNWLGEIDFGQNRQRFDLHFSTGTEGWTGTLDWPRQDAKAAALKRVVLEGSRVQCEWQGAGEPVTLTGRIEGDAISGDLQQGDTRAVLHLLRVRSTDVDLALYEHYAGSYQLASDRVLDLAPFYENEDRLLVFDSRTRRNHVLFAQTETEFFAGPTVGYLFPVEFRVTFVREGNTVTGLHWQEGEGQPQFAKRLAPYRSEEVTFENGNVSLRGTLTLPPTEGPHPAVVLVHGSGAGRRPGGHLTPFLARHGIALLLYDKRGAGASTGNWRESTYEDLAADALAAVRLLKNHKSIDPQRIGLWGHSEGGWVAPLAASRSPDVAFVMIKSGSALPPRITVLHEGEGKLRDGHDLSEAEIRAALALKETVERIALTERMWDEAWVQIDAAYQKARDEKWFGYVGGIPKDHWFWKWWRLRGDYDPAPALEGTRCPVLVLLGELDSAIPAKASAAEFTRVFEKAGNQDYTIRVLPHASHGLFEAETGLGSEGPRCKRYVAGYMDGVAAWLREHVQAERPRPAAKEP